MGLSRWAPHVWLKAGEIPVKRAHEVAALTGIPAHELRPDFFDPPATRRRA